MRRLVDFKRYPHFMLRPCIVSDTDPKPRATMRRNKQALLLRLLFAAIVAALSALLVGLFYANADRDHLFPIRQLLHDELSAYGSAVATDSTNASAPFVKSQLVSFRALQPDGSLEIKHIDVDTAVRVDTGSNEADAPVVAIKPRHNKQRLRSGRRLQQVQDDDDDDDDSSEDLAFYRKVSTVLLLEMEELLARHMCCTQCCFRSFRSSVDLTATYR